jgi:hypothetical protein
MWNHHLLSQHTVFEVQIALGHLPDTLSLVALSPGSDPNTIRADGQVLRQSPDGGPM